jgi:hypothetical protein
MSTPAGIAELDAEQALQHRQAAQDRRRVVGVAVRGEELQVGEEAAPPGGDPPPATRRGRQAIKRGGLEAGKPRLEVGIVERAARER